MQNLHDAKNNARETDGDHRRSGNTKVLSRTTITNTSLKVDHAKDKELINSGLHKLVSTFNTNKVGQKPSKIIETKKSEIKTPGAPTTESLPERQQSSHIVLSKQVSIDKYTMTDFKEHERKIGLESPIFSERPERSERQERPYSNQGRDLQWTDPRLLKKYAFVKQPHKKSLTVPHVNKSEYDSDPLEELSEADAELLYSDKKHFFFKFLYYFCTASVSFIGSMCGITLITVILWKILDVNMFSFQLEAPRHDLFFTRHLTNFAGSIIYLINAILGKIMRLLTISTNEAFAKENDGSRWYSNYIRY